MMTSSQGLTLVCSLLHYWNSAGGQYLQWSHQQLQVLQRKKSKKCVSLLAFVGIVPFRAKLLPKKTS